MKHLSTLKAATMLAMLAALFISQEVNASGKPVRKYAANETIVAKEDPAKVKKTAAKYFSPLNNSSVKIHPATIKREMHVVAKENEGKQIDFFVFDMDGTLVQHYKMEHKNHYKLTGLKKGIYVYNVFSGDEQTAAGKFEVR